MQEGETQASSLPRLNMIDAGAAAHAGRVAHQGNILSADMVPSKMVGWGNWALSSCASSAALHDEALVTGPGNVLASPEKVIFYKRGVTGGVGGLTNQRHAKTLPGLAAQTGQEVQRCSLPQIRPWPRSRRYAMYSITGELWRWSPCPRVHRYRGSQLSTHWERT
jgi:hypothetical protein